MNSKNPIANEAFPKLLDLLKLDPNEFRAGQKEKDSWRYTIGEMDRMEQAVTVFNCLALNDGEITAQLILSKVLDEYLEDRTYTLSEMLKNADIVQHELELVKGIREVLNRDDVVLRRVEFTETLEGAMHHYGAQERKDVQDLIEDDAQLGILRRSALTAMKDMAIAQFLKGEEGDSVRPQYSTVIRRWWDIDHLLAAHTRIPEGVSLNLVKTPHEHDMFFCFVVRRGANLYVLNDAPEYDHPLQSQMSRRPDRNMANRINKFWFPYDLADVMMSEDGREAHVKRDKGERERGIALMGRINDISQPVGTVAELPPHELLWTAMMFDLIMDRFWSSQPLPTLPISYTSTQLKPEGQLLLESAQHAGLPVVVGQLGHVAVPDFSVTDVRYMHKQKDVKKTLGETGSYGSLAWIEARYADNIPADAMNLISSGNDLARIGLDGGLFVLEKPDHDKIDNDRFFGRDKALLSLQSLDKTKFGTADMMRADRSFLARHNYAKSIEAFAIKEYNERKEEIQDWLQKAYSKRAEFFKTLAPAAYAKNMKIVDWESGEDPDSFEFIGGHAVSFSRTDFFANKQSSRDGCTHQLGWVAEIDSPETGFMPYIRQGGEAARSWKPLCQVTGAAASYYFAVKPTNAQELAWLLGLEVKNLPDVLQHISALAPACGNSILNRIDPMLWALDNPWHKLKIGARMGLSKRGLAQLIKTHPGEIDLSHLNKANLHAFTHSEDTPLATEGNLSKKKRSLTK